MSFNSRLRKLRLEKGLTQKELGNKLNISDRVIGYYEAGDRFPKDENTLKQLSSIFNVSVDYLLGRTDKKNLCEPETIAVRHDGDEFTEEELEDIENFKEFIKMKRQQKEGSDKK